VNRIIQAVMDEHVALPGCPEIVVTRGWAYRWLTTTLGFDPKERGFGSVDYMVFGRREVDAPLSDLDSPQIQSTLRLMERMEAIK
jgi:hypothetical protein